ncbi:hypothetical protein KUL42_30140 [Alteromonas sp. KUL42]|uniref:GNAT family N-acetyltransferase n=1 Tax=Alteromonas sp. KUL42 TaxID=2480797 RepID=UPI00103638E1|nr:GNAT family N-acetyltransferase [Alteromonas sp. KUL42]TAP33747.1 N-acetyltransferase [Alteromonas sp. KUL42]GEA08253.1 hypothetical protein KUL42_30140 [Alteromonas sp. KUL42]
MNSFAMQNSSNLLALWRCYGAEKKGGLWFSTGWPHRVWHDTLDYDTTIRALSDIHINEKYQVATMSNKSTEVNVSSTELNADATLRLMHFHIPRAPQILESHARLELLERDDMEGIRAFMNMCSEGFGYAIELASLCRAAKQEGAKLGFLQVNNVRVATILLFRQGESLGVFQLTVPPNYRGKQYATQLMLQTIDWAQTQGVSLITLQASDMGLALYQRLGFKTSGSITFWRQQCTGSH